MSAETTAAWKRVWGIGGPPQGTPRVAAVMSAWLHAVPEPLAGGDDGMPPGDAAAEAALLAEVQLLLRVPTQAAGRPLHYAATSDRFLAGALIRCDGPGRMGLPRDMPEPAFRPLHNQRRAAWRAVVLELLACPTTRFGRLATRETRLCSTPLHDVAFGAVFGDDLEMVAALRADPRVPREVWAEHWWQFAESVPMLALLGFDARTWRHTYAPHGTALHVYPGGSRTIKVPLLLAAGADPDARDGAGKTALRSHLDAIQTPDRAVEAEAAVLALAAVTTDVSLDDVEGARAALLRVQRRIWQRVDGARAAAVRTLRVVARAAAWRRRRAVLAGRLLVGAAA